MRTFLVCGALCWPQQATIILPSALRPHSTAHSAATAVLGDWSCSTIHVRCRGRAQADHQRVDSAGSGPPRAAEAAASEGGYNPYGRTVYDPRTAIYAAVEAEDWEPAAAQRGSAERRVEIQDAASLDLGVGGWLGWSAKGGMDEVTDSAAPGSRVPGLIPAVPPPAHASGARSIAAAASAEQLDARRVSGMQPASGLHRNQPAVEPSVGTLPRPRTGRASRFAELLGSDGPQHRNPLAAQPAATAAAPFDAEKAFRMTSPPGIISLKHIASQPPQPPQAEAPVQQARRLADAPPLGNSSSSRVEGVALVPVDPHQLLLPAPGAKTRVTRLADAPPLGSQKAAAMQPSGSAAAPSEARTSTLRLRSRWGDVDAADGPEGGALAQPKQDRRLRLPDSTPARGATGSPSAVSAAAGPVTSTQHAEERGASTAVSQPAMQKTAMRKPTQPQPSTVAFSDVRPGAAGGARPVLSLAEVRDALEGSSRFAARTRPSERPRLDIAEVREALEGTGRWAPRNQPAQSKAAVPVSAPEATRPASPAARPAAEPRPSRQLRPSAPRAAELPDWMVAEPDWLVAASAALDVLPVPFLALPSPLLSMRSVPISDEGADQVGGFSGPQAVASADDLPPHLLAAHDQLLAVDEAAGVSPSQRPATAATADMQPAKRRKPASKEPQQRHAGPDSGAAADAKPAAKPSKADRRRSGTAEADAPSRRARPVSVTAAALPASAAADGAASRPASANSIRASTAGSGAANAPLSADAPARRAPKAVNNTQLRHEKKRAAAPAALAPAAKVSKPDAPAATAATRPAASQPQRYVPTGRLEQKAAPSRALATKVAGLQAAPRPAPVRVTTWEAAPPPQAPDPNLIITFESSDDDEEGEVHDVGAAVPVPASPAEAALDRAAQAAAASGSSPPLASSAADDALARQMAELRAGMRARTLLQCRSFRFRSYCGLVLLKPCTDVTISVVTCSVFLTSSCSCQHEVA